MAENLTRRNWAGVRFHPSRRLQLPEAFDEKKRRVNDLQADEGARFAAARQGLIDRLDLSRGVATTMTCDHRFSLLFENWAASCDRFGIGCRSSTIVFPTDRSAFERIESLGFVAYFDDESQLLREMTDSGQYGDAAWVEYMYHQNWVINGGDGTKGLVTATPPAIHGRVPRRRPTTSV